MNIILSHYNALAKLQSATADSVCLSYVVMSA